MAFKYDSNGKIIWSTTTTPQNANITKNMVTVAPSTTATNLSALQKAVYGGSKINKIVTGATDTSEYQVSPEKIQSYFETYKNSPQYKGETYQEWYSNGGQQAVYQMEHDTTNYGNSYLEGLQPGSQAETEGSHRPNGETTNSTTNSTTNATTSGTNTILDNVLSAIQINAAKLIADQQKIIDETPGVYQNLKNTTYNQSLAGLPSLYERLSNLGASTTGGLSRTEQGKVQSNLQNNLTSLDLQKQGVINDAQHNIGDINSDAASQTATQTADYLSNEQSRQDTLNANAKADAWTSVSQLGYVDANASEILGIPEGTKTSATNQIEWEQEQTRQATAKADHETEVTEYVNTIGQYYNDFGAEIKKIANDGDTSNDWKLPYLKAARQEKRNTMAAQKIADKNAQATAVTKFNQDMYDRGMEIWQTSGYLPKGYEDYLGYPAGTPTAAQAKKNSSSSKSSNSSSSKSSGKPLSYTAVGDALAGTKKAAEDNGTSTTSVPYVADTFAYIDSQSNLTQKQKDALCRQYLGRTYAQANNVYKYTEAVKQWSKYSRAQIEANKTSIVKSIGEYYYNALLSKHPK